MIKYTAYKIGKLKKRTNPKLIWNTMNKKNT